MAFDKNTHTIERLRQLRRMFNKATGREQGQDGYIPNLKNDSPKELYARLVQAIQEALLERPDFYDEWKDNTEYSPLLDFAVEEEILDGIPDPDGDDGEAEEEEPFDDEPAPQAAKRGGKKQDLEPKRVKARTGPEPDDEEEEEAEDPEEEAEEEGDDGDELEENDDGSDEPVEDEPEEEEPQGGPPEAEEENGGWPALEQPRDSADDFLDRACTRITQAVVDGFAQGLDILSGKTPRQAAHAGPAGSQAKDVIQGRFARIGIVPGTMTEDAISEALKRGPLKKKADRLAFMEEAGQAAPKNTSDRGLSLKIRAVLKNGGK